MKTKVNHWTAYTDGAASGNPGPGGWAFVLLSPDGVIIERSGHSPKSTSNRMELAALYEVLDTVRIRDPKASVVVRTDSKYVCDGFSSGLRRWPKSGWMTLAGTPVHHRDLWEPLTEFQSRVELQKVPGHAGYAPNERVDRLAVDASKGVSVEKEYPESAAYAVSREVLWAEIPTQSLKKWPHPVYLSYVDGRLERHQSWPACEKRVKGAFGAKFKKVQTDAEEERTLALWGIEVGGA